MDWWIDKWKEGQVGGKTDVQTDGPTLASMCSNDFILGQGSIHVIAWLVRSPPTPQAPCESSEFQVIMTWIFSPSSRQSQNNRSYQKSNDTSYGRFGTFKPGVSCEFKILDDRAGSLIHTLFIFYKDLVFKNIKAWNCSRIKNIVVILLVAISISFEGFGQEMTFL